MVCEIFKKYFLILYYDFLKYKKLVEIITKYYIIKLLDT